MKNLSMLLIAALAFAVSTGSAQAVPIKTAIGLSLDGSGSINNNDFALQRDAYANVLGNASILPADGSVVLYVNQFSDSVQTEAMARRISSEADRAALISDINAITRFGVLTDIGDGINDAATSLDDFLGSFGSADFASDFRAVIDVSTDGEGNLGPSASGAAQDAIAGVGLDNIKFNQVNCLGVGLAANCGFIPTGSFQIAANDFNAFQDSLEQKLGRELGTGGDNGNGGDNGSGGGVDVPESSNLALFMLAIIGVGAASLRRGRRRS